ncbi:MAG: fasciclin domain-containing protein [Actinobacteria bacterium]|nr:fasciclin domain-containing protein [Actinomycetota bacterium]
MAAAVAIPAMVQAAPAKNTSNLSLAQILLSDSKKDAANGFDRNPNDFDIVTQALLLFPDLVEAASNPGDYTVFLPTDYAFRLLVKDLTGKKVFKESDVFAAVATLGTDTVKTVLTYHIVPGARVDYKAATKSDGAELKTLQGNIITVDVQGKNRVILMDGDPDLRDPRVIFPNIKASNGIAHGINRVLIPVNL